MMTQPKDKRKQQYTARGQGTTINIGGRADNVKSFSHSATARPADALTFTYFFVSHAQLVGDRQRTDELSALYHQYSTNIPPIGLVFGEQHNQAKIALCYIGRHGIIG